MIVVSGDVVVLLLAINNGSTQFVVMAWHGWRDLASRVFGDTCGSQTHWMVLSHCWPAAAWHAVGLTQNKPWRGPCTGEPPHCLCNRCTYFRVHRSLLLMAQSPIRLIVMRSSTPSLTRHLSHGAWAPVKSGGDNWHNLHVLLGDVWTWYFCCHFCNQQSCLLHSAIWHCFLWWWHKGLTPTHLFWWQSQQPVSLQAPCHFNEKW